METVFFILGSGTAIITLLITGFIYQSIKLNKLIDRCNRLDEYSKDSYRYNNERFDNVYRQIDDRTNELYRSMEQLQFNNSKQILVD
jgi:hypothetical protein